MDLCPTTNVFWELKVIFAMPHAKNSKHLISAWIFTKPSHTPIDFPVFSICFLIKLRLLKMYILPTKQIPISYFIQYWFFFSYMLVTVFKKCALPTTAFLLSFMDNMPIRKQKNLHMSGEPAHQLIFWHEFYL